MKTYDCPFQHTLDILNDKSNKTLSYTALIHDLNECSNSKEVLSFKERVKSYYDDSSLEKEDYNSLNHFANQLLEAYNK